MLTSAFIPGTRTESGRPEDFQSPRCGHRTLHRFRLGGHPFAGPLLRLLAFQISLGLPCVTGLSLTYRIQMCTAVLACLFSAQAPDDGRFRQQCIQVTGRCRGVCKAQIAKQFMPA